MSERITARLASPLLAAIVERRLIKGPRSVRKVIWGRMLRGRRHEGGVKWRLWRGDDLG